MFTYLYNGVADTGLKLVERGFDQSLAFQLLHYSGFDQNFAFTIQSFAVPIEKLGSVF